MSNQKLRAEGRASLQAAFFAALDSSRITQLLALDFREMDCKHVVIGEGAHFRAWRLKRPTAAGAPMLDLVLKRPTAGFAAPESVAFRDWLKVLQLLPKLAAQPGASLLPPFVWLGQGADPAGGMIAGGMVMPYGEEPWNAAAPAWQPLDERLAELRSSLGGFGLVWSDLAQGRCWRGIPFLFDLSDFRLQQPAAAQARLMPRLVP